MTKYFEDEPLREDLAVRLATGRAWIADHTEWAELDEDDRRARIFEADAWLEAAGAGGLATLSLAKDTGHFRERTEHTASVVTEAVGVLVYAAEKNGGLVYPGDVYRLMGEFRVVGDRIPELGERIGQFLEREHNAGHLRRDDDGDVTADVREALDRLNDLRQAGTAFYNAATKAQAALSHVATVETEVNR